VSGGEGIKWNPAIRLGGDHKAMFSESRKMSSIILSGNSQNVAFCSSLQIVHYWSGLNLCEKKAPKCG
jgi:hypothetical protein